LFRDDESFLKKNLEHHIWKRKDVMRSSWKIMTWKRQRKNKKKLQIEKMNEIYTM
jgi:hypothetical protein